MNQIYIHIYIICSLLLVGCKSSGPQISYNSYEGLVMAGYQGWFNAEGDGANRGFYHYRGHDGFKPGSASIDMWPDVHEYPKTYPTDFVMSDGSIASVFSSFDQSTIDTHFRWMKEYGLDGVFMQRFVSEIKGESGRNHFNKVLSSAMAASNKYNRAICIMYDLSGMAAGDETLVLEDINEIANKYNIFDHKKNSSYLYHNSKPLVAVWGVGFNDKRNYSIDNCENLISGLKAQGYSVMIGVPTYWRELKDDTEPTEQLHELIKICDIVMPWFVARYTPDSFKDFSPIVSKDLTWCNNNGIDYAPLVFPGFSWKNMYGENTLSIPRCNGTFLQRQIDNAISSGVSMLYVAMFDEIDEGTAIFKCATKVPVDSLGTSFVPIEEGLSSDHYLKIIGEASKRLKQASYSN